MNTKVIFMFKTGSLWWTLFWRDRFRWVFRLWDFLRTPKTFLLRSICYLWGEVCLTSSFRNWPVFKNLHFCLSPFPRDLATDDLNKKYSLLFPHRRANSKL